MNQLHQNQDKPSQEEFQFIDFEGDAAVNDCSDNSYSSFPDLNKTMRPEEFEVSDENSNLGSSQEGVRLNSFTPVKNTDTLVKDIQKLRLGKESVSSSTSPGFGKSNHQAEISRESNQAAKTKNGSLSP